MKKFRILKRTFGTGVAVFIPQHFNVSGWYSNVCSEMRQSINSFETEKEAFEKIEEYKKYLKDSKVISEEIIQVNDDFLVCKKEQKIMEKKYKYRIVEIVKKNGTSIFKTEIEHFMKGYKVPLKDYNFPDSTSWFEFGDVCKTKEEAVLQIESYETLKVIYHEYPQ